VSDRALVDTNKFSVSKLSGAFLTAPYAIRFARSNREIIAAQELRFEVFNLELHEGLDQSFVSGRDYDTFDDVCDHLIVEYVPTQKVVGTYRMQTGTNAKLQRGYYCEQEFDFRPYESFRPEIIELGRACVHKQHRNLIVLGLLWKGIADYAVQKGGRYLLGCSSLTSQDPAVGAAMFAQLYRKHIADLVWQTNPLPDYTCPTHELHDEPVKVPKLLHAYLSIGARICGPPALDRQFKTIDFLTLLDLKFLRPAARQKFF